MLKRFIPAMMSSLLFSTCLYAGSAIPITDFGAVADDDTDDSAAINKAIRNAKPGDTVSIPEGTFILSDEIQLTRGILLKGSGQAETVLRHHGRTPHCLMRLKGANDVEVRNMTLDGGNSPNALQGIVASACNRLHLHHLTIRNFVDTGKFGPHGILFTGTSHSTISDNTITNVAPSDPWGAGIRVGDRSLGNRVLRNIIHNTGRGGILTNNGSTDAVISENVITESHGIAFAIEVHSRSVRTVVEDNIVDHGLSIVSPNCAVRRNLVVDPTGTWGSYGIEGGGGPNGVVTDNIIDYGQKQGISISGGSSEGNYLFWSRNRFLNCSQWGIQFQGTSEDRTISCMYFYRNTFAKAKRGHPSARYPGQDGHAIRFNGYTKHVVFDSNRITDNAGLAIQMTSAKGVNHISFIDNVITNNAMGSYNRYPDTAVIWEGNLVSGNGNNDRVLRTKGFTGKPPIASFSCPTTAQVGEPVRFSNSSTAPGSAIGHVLWDFDAGVPCTDMNPSYVYQRPGAYRVSLVVWNTDGWGGRPAEKTILVRAE